MENRRTPPSPSGRKALSENAQRVARIGDTRESLAILVFTEAIVI